MTAYCYFWDGDKFLTGLAAAFDAMPFTLSLSRKISLAAQNRRRSVGMLQPAMFKVTLIFSIAVAVLPAVFYCRGQSSQSVTECHSLMSLNVE